MSTHRIEEHSEEELAAIDDLVQLAGATRVLIVEDGVCEEAARLPREDLGMGQGRAMASPGMDGGRRPSLRRTARVSPQKGSLLCDYTAPTLGGLLPL